MLAPPPPRLAPPRLIPSFRIPGVVPSPARTDGAAAAGLPQVLKAGAAVVERWQAAINPNPLGFNAGDTVLKVVVVGGGGSVRGQAGRPWAGVGGWGPGGEGMRMCLAEQHRAAHHYTTTTAHGWPTPWLQGSMPMPCWLPVGSWA